MKRAFISAVLTTSVIALLAPVAALAARSSTATQPRVYAGTICAYTAGSSVTIGQSCGSPSDVTIAIGRRARLAYRGSTSPIPAPVPGDAGAAFVWYNKNNLPVAWKLEYSENTFTYAKTLIRGTYVASTGNCSAGTLSIQRLGSQGSEVTVTTNGYTVYQNGGNTSSCSSVTGAYAANEPIIAWVFELSNGTWAAVRINANPVGANRNPSSDQHVVFGIICAYTPGQSAIISQDCGSSSDITVTFDKNTWLVYQGSTSPVPAPVVGDSAAAYLRWVNNFATVGEFAYGEDAFAFAHSLLRGRYVSSTGTCSSGSLTIRNLGSASDTIFATDAYTIYENAGKASTCAAVTGGYKAGENLFVAADEITDGSWYARRVNAHPYVSHRHPRKGLKVLFGTICSYAPHRNVTISQDCGSPSDITVKLGAEAKLDYEGSGSPVPAPAVGDSAAAFLRWHKNTPITWKLEYSENTFAFAKAQFLGSYVSSDGTCSTGDLTIQGYGKAHAQRTFSTDAYTVYLSRGKASTCAAVSGSYASGEKLRVNADAMTDNTWYATRVDALPRKK